MKNKLKVGCPITIYGQCAIIDRIEGDLIYLTESIVVPTIDYTREYVTLNEIINYTNKTKK